ncbi:MAG: phosphatase PAP2 family protein [Ignavibacteriae bacterium]|nr:phosphatase PAP2 family protein [Ignavibacteriota bacterium]
MIDFLYSVDKALFVFLNQTISNPLFDVVMPFLTDLNKSPIGWFLFISTWLLFLLKGGKKGRIVGLMVIPLILMSDQVSSTVIKNIVMRPRPCHEVDGFQMFEQIRLLVPCGSGYSFPSSHAVNSFALATFLSYHYRRWAWACFTFSGLIAFSRVSVGVHYPSDILGGAMLGNVCGGVMILVLNYTARYSSFFDSSQSPAVDQKS